MRFSQLSILISAIHIFREQISSRSNIIFVKFRYVYQHRLNEKFINLIFNEEIIGGSIN